MRINPNPFVTLKIIGALLFSKVDSVMAFITSAHLAILIMSFAEIISSSEVSDISSSSEGQES